jgi:squalene-hopene/tetraprenyl-beta-curcumene cyclase
MEMHMKRLSCLAVALSLVLLPMSAARAADEELVQQTQQLIDKGLSYLKSQQKPDGGWQGEKDPPAMTALVLRAFVQHPDYDSKTDFVKRGFEKLLSQQVADGGIYKDLLANYNTAIAISTLAAAKDPELKPAMDKAVAYLKRLQWTMDTVSAEQESLSGPDDPWLGGWGYGGRSRGKGRPDLSNTQMALEALHDAGVPKDDPAYQLALKFVERLQNNSENDGGFIYGPSDDRQGESFAGSYEENGQRRLRSYGAMTYAGLKSFIYAGLTKDDPRVQAAWGWITRNWTLDENPGMRAAGADKAKSGLFYYYHTLARALNEYDEAVITDPEGNTHDWREEFVQKMAELQNEDGSWSGEKRYMEDNPVLVTAYVVLALQEVQKDLQGAK